MFKFSLSLLFAATLVACGGGNSPPQQSGAQSLNPPAVTPRPIDPVLDNTVPATVTQPATARPSAT
ncbi:MAG: hypothetical protein JWQ01_2817 [Massilia sp.]|nr:hypothetical protein [Massilia sp.]